MIIQLLREIASPGVKSNTMLGARLGVSEAMIEELVNDLENRGYLSRVEMCTTGCSTCTGICPFAGKTSEPLVFWELTDKGRRAIFLNH